MLLIPCCCRYQQRIQGISDLEGAHISVAANETIVPSKRGAKKRIHESSGLAGFSSLQLRAINQNMAYSMTLSFTSSSSRQAFDGLRSSLRVTLSACKRGMVPPKSGVGACENCDANKYVLPGQSQCNNCENGASCENGDYCLQLLDSNLRACRSYLSTARLVERSWLCHVLSMCCC